MRASAMVRRFSLIGVAGALAMGLAACGTNDDPGSGTTDTATGSPTDSTTEVTAVTLTVWAPQEDQVDASSWLPTQQAAFEAAHPQYDITWKNSVVSEGDAAKTVTQDPTAAADVYMFANDQLGTLIQAHAIGELPPAALAQVTEQNDEVMIKSVTGTDGKVYGVPFTGNTWFMYYDASKFTEADIANLDTMMAKDKVAFPLDNSWNIAAFYMGNGATLFGPDGTDAAAGIDFGGTRASDVTKYLVAMAQNPNFVNDSNGAGLAGLQNGTIAAYFSGSWDAEKVKEALGDNMGAAQPPTFTLNGTDVQMRAFAGSKAIAWNPNAQVAQVAAEFAAFLGSTQAQQDHYTMRNIIPTDVSLAAELSDDIVALAQMNTIANASVLQPTIPEMNNYWTPAESFGKSILSGEVTLDNAVDKTEAWNASYQ